MPKQAPFEEGYVKWFNAAKGYGFAERESGEDVFIHFSAINMAGYKQLPGNPRIRFQVVNGPKGLHAENVTVVGQDHPNHNGTISTANGRTPVRRFITRTHNW